MPILPCLFRNEYDGAATVGCRDVRGTRPNECGFERAAVIHPECGWRRFLDPAAEGIIHAGQVIGTWLPSSDGPRAVRGGKEFPIIDGDSRAMSGADASSELVQPVVSWNDRDSPSCDAVERKVDLMVMSSHNPDLRKPTQTWAALAIRFRSCAPVRRCWSNEGSFPRSLCTVLFMR
jgi:hypothetical protein